MLRGVKGVRPFSSEVVKSEFKPLVIKSKGPGGRSSSSGHVATVFGCTGFMGRYVVNNLGKIGTQVVLPYRGNFEEVRHLKVMGDLGQLAPLRFDLRDEQSLVESMKYSDTVFNLIGKHYPTKNFSFEKVHVEGARQLARLARELGVTKFVHVSALNADVNSKSDFLRTKALGEEAVKEEFPNAVIIRPGHMFGHEDRFWNRMGWFMQYYSNTMPVVNLGQTKMLPVYVGDVAAVVARQMKEHESVGKIVELYGPKEYYYNGLLQLFIDVSKRNANPLYLPKPVAKFAASAMSFLQAYPLITADEVERLAIDDNPSDPNSVMTFKDFGLNPVSAEDSVVRFIRLFRPAEFQRASYEVTRKYDVAHFGLKDKNKHLKLYIQPPSIPTQFQTFHFDDHEPRAFNSTAPRFLQNPGELPGPGYYNKDTSFSYIASNTESVSQKGFGIGFASHSKRFTKKQIFEASLGPATYTITPHPRHPYASTTTSSFHEPMTKPVPIPQQQQTPGPNAYNIEKSLKSTIVSNGKSKVEDNGATFVFKSRTRRSQVNEPECTPGRFAPAPGLYNVDVLEAKPGAVAAFKATKRAPMHNSKVASEPGPGTYNITNTKIPHFARRYCVASIVEPPRFNPANNFQHQNVPGPGSYNLRKSADVNVADSKAITSTFVSVTPRFLPLKSITAGPGFYQPLTEVRNKSYRLNTENLWS